MPEPGSPEAALAARQRAAESARKDRMEKMAKAQGGSSRVDAFGAPIVESDSERFVRGTMQPDYDPTGSGESWYNTQPKEGSKLKEAAEESMFAAWVLTAVEMFKKKGQEKSTPQMATPEAAPKQAAQQGAEQIDQGLQQRLMQEQMARQQEAMAQQAAAAANNNDVFKNLAA